MEILILDDQKNVCEDIRRMIEEMELPGFKKIYEAESTKHAKETLLKENVGIVVADIVLEGENGFGLLEFIKSKEISVSVILMTGYPQMDYALEAIRYHVDSFLVKPISPIKLKEALVSASKHLAGYEDRKNISYHLECLMLDAYLRGDSREIDFGRLSESVGLDQIRTPHIMIAQADVRIPNDHALRQKRFFDDIRRCFPQCVCYAPGLERIVVMIGAEDVHGVVKQLEEIFNKHYRDYYMGCACRPRSFSTISVYSIASQTLEMAKVMGISGKCYLPDREAFCKSVCGQYEMHMRSHMGDREALNADLGELCNRFSLYGEAAYDLYKSLCALEFPTADVMIRPDCSMMRMRAVLLDAWTAAASREIPEHITAMLDYIDKHYAEKITLSSVANTVNISYTYASMLFKKHLNTNFCDYLMQIRMKKACLLMRSTNCYIYEVAHKVGFPNEKYFIRQFKKIYGMTPQTFLRREDGPDD